MVVIMIIITYLNHTDKPIEYTQEDIFRSYKYFISVPKCKKCCKVKEKKNEKKRTKEKKLSLENLYL